MLNKHMSDPHGYEVKTLLSSLIIKYSSPLRQQLLTKHFFLFSRERSGRGTLTSTCFLHMIKVIDVACLLIYLCGNDAILVIPVIQIMNDYMVPDQCILLLRKLTKSVRS